MPSCGVPPLLHDRFSSVRGVLDPLLAVTYAAMFTWWVIGGVWFFNSDFVNEGSCVVLRRFGVGYVLSLAVVVCSPLQPLLTLIFFPVCCVPGVYVFF